MENCTSEAGLTKSHLCVVYAWDCFSHSPFTNPQMQSKHFQSWLVTSQFNNHKTHRTGTDSGKIHVALPHIYFWNNFLSVILSFTCSPASVTGLQLCVLFVTPGELITRYLHVLYHVFISLPSGDRCWTAAEMSNANRFAFLPEISILIFLQYHICHLIY